jgi:2-iminobutanoate/2-iminopropanoate deaminase
MTGQEGHLRARVVRTDDAPKAIGPYSQAMVSGGFVYCSGQVGLDPGSGQLVAGGIREETRRVLDNLAAVLKAAGSSTARVVRCTVYLKSLADFAAMNEVYGQYFPQDPPARATVEVARLPKDALVEIDCIGTIG